ncbi:MAG: heavy-metal-associated domain-containing protein [Bacteroidetes bacterium]|nr:heavy-metal-associated domain-containing protein [Bacteroidota bacterium]
MTSAQQITKNKDKKIITETFKVDGCCSDCKDRIEAALDVKGIRYASWETKTHILTVTFNTKKINIQDIHNRIAAVGHDTELVKAVDSVYNTLPECCQYRGGSECSH